jgi:hypothetical protein
MGFSARQMEGAFFRNNMMLTVATIVSDRYRSIFGKEST